MFRIVVGVLAAFVGFSFGHSIPKWMESKSKSATEMQSSSSSESAHPAHKKLLLRRKSLRKFKFGSQKSGKENVESIGPLQKSSKVKSDNDGSLQNLKYAQISPLYASGLNPPARAEQKKFKCCFQKSSLDNNMMDQRSSQGLDCAPIMPVCVVSFDHERCSLKEICTNSDEGGCTYQGKCEKSDSKSNAYPQGHAEEAPCKEPKLRGSVFCKISSTQSICGSPVKERSQMKQWKMKLMSLRSKAMASEKAWYQKFEIESSGGKLFTPSPKNLAAKKTAKGKENESPQLMSTKKRDLPSWSRSSSSSRVGLLVEGPKSAFER